MSTNQILTAPGVLKLSCFINEPIPLVDRIKQEVYFDYTKNVLNEGYNLSKINTKNIVKNLTSIPGFNSILLKTRDIVYDTFLVNPVTTQSSGNTTLQYNPIDYSSTDFLDFNANPLYDSNNNPTSAWISHQTFYPIKPLYTNIATNQWTYTTVNRPYVPYQNQLEFDTTKTINANYSNRRKNIRFNPIQIAASQYNAPTHWMVEKQYPLFSGEDFFVEFQRLSSRYDVFSGPNPMYDEYAYLDSKSNKTAKGANSGISIPVNLGVIQYDDKGQKLYNSGIDLSNQPYYMIHLNPNAMAQGESYIILITLNSPPVFLVVGNQTVAIPSGGSNNKIVLDQTTATTSYVLSTYNIDGSALMQNDFLNVRVQNVKGKYVITFNGDTTKSWIVQGFKYDYNTWKANNNNNEDTVPQIPSYLQTYSDTIRIGAGNVLSGFAFSPVHYEEYGYVEHDDTISVNGPILQGCINLQISDKLTRNITKNGSAITVSSYSQEADVYIETNGGTDTAIQESLTERKNILSQSVVIPQESSTPFYSYPEIYQIKGYYIPPGNTSIGPNRPSPFGYKTNNSTVSSNVGTPDGSPFLLSYIRTKQTSPLAVNPAIAKDAEASKYAAYYPKQFTMKYELGAGDVVVGQGTGNAWHILRCISPVGNGWRLYVPQSYRTVDKTLIASQQPNCIFDVGQNVINFNLNTSFTTNEKIDKSGSIKFIINPGTMTSVNLDGNFNAQGLDEWGRNIKSTNQQCDKNSYSAYDNSAYLSSLSGKVFFIRVYARWDGGFMSCQNQQCPCKSSSQIDQSGNPYVVFTGLCHGGQVTVENGKRYMDCQLLDYWQILKDTKWLNSPFFDGMRNFNALYEILQYAGFYSGTTSTDIVCSDNAQSSTASNSAAFQDPYPPGLFIKQIALNTNEYITTTSIGGESFNVRSYGLPSAYDIYQDPKYKFSDGSSYDESVQKIAELSGYTAYFDRYGIFKFIPSPQQRVCDQSFISAVADGSSMDEIIKCNFYASPTAYKLNNKNLGTGCGGYDTLAFNSYMYQKKVSDTYNDILMVTATPNGEVLIKSKVNIPGKFDHTANGYIGYTKRLIQFDGVFGSAQALDRTINYYSAFFTPPVTMTWEGFGTPLLNAGDIVSFTGLQTDVNFPTANINGDSSNVLQNSKLDPSTTVLLYLTGVSMNIDPFKNEWVNKYEGEWIFVDCDNLA